MTNYFTLIKFRRENAMEALHGLDDINIRDEDDENLLHVAAVVSDVKIAHYLIERGIDVNAQDSEGMTPLHYSCTYNHAEITKIILDNGGDMTIVDKHGNTPLWTAVFNARGKYDIVNTLIEKGAARIAHQKNIHGRSPIDFATQIGDTALVNLMSKDS